MINRETKTVELLTYSQAPDEYGQLRQTTPTAINIEMVLKIYKQENTGDMRFVNTEVIGLTKYSDITDKNEIKDGNDIYQILYIIPTSRFNQIFMRKKH